LYQPVLEAYGRLEALIERLDTKVVRQVIEEAGLAPASDPTLFELLITFSLLGMLKELGWELDPFRLLSNGLEMHGARREAKLSLWYQRAPTDLVQDSIWSQVLGAHSITTAAQRPDIVVRIEDHTTQPPVRWLLIECKMYGNVADGARQATKDLLEYRQSFTSVLEAQNQPYGIGVTWGEDLAPDSTEIRLCTPDRLRDALIGLLD